MRAENLDLSLFQFDPDLSFAVFFINADKTIYGRFGSRSDFYEADREVSLEGLRKAMESALAWHKDIEKLRDVLNGKRGPTPKYKTLADFPTTGGRRGSRGGRGGGRCTHCHDIRTAEQMSYRSAGEPIPENVLFSWPMPDAVGLQLDPKEKAKVVKVWEKSPAEKSGFQAGDEILTLSGQLILSIADVQWILHNSGDDQQLTATVLRSGAEREIKLELAKGWRRYVDISWRTTTDVLRRRLLNGVEYRDLSAEDRQELGLAKKVVALKAARGASRNTGLVRRDDIVVEIDGQDKYKSEGDLLAYFAQEKKVGEEVTFTLLRSGERVKASVPVR